MKKEYIVLAIVTLALVLTTNVQAQQQDPYVAIFVYVGSPNETVREEFMDELEYELRRHPVMLRGDLDVGEGGTGHLPSVRMNMHILPMSFNEVHSGYVGFYAAHRPGLDYAMEMVESPAIQGHLYTQWVQGGPNSMGYIAREMVKQLTSSHIPLLIGE